MRRIGQLAILAMALAFTAGSGDAIAQAHQGGAQGAQQGNQQGAQQAGEAQRKRQAERAMSHEQTMDQVRLQSRERTQTTDARQQKAASGEGIYGGNLMTEQERNTDREQLRVLESEQERDEFRARHREQMEVRSKERGVPAEVTAN